MTTIGSDGERDAYCWICYEDGASELGQPLRRDCSCRGTDAGYLHLSCLVEYAKQKSEQWNGGDEMKLSEPWIKCPSCKQAYQNELALDLANELVSFVEERHLGNQLVLLAALNQKLGVLMKGTYQQKLKDDGKETANRIITIIDSMRASFYYTSYQRTDGALPRHVLVKEGIAYHNLGAFTFHEGTKASAKKSVSYYKKAIGIWKGINPLEVGLIAAAECNISLAKAKYEGGKCNMKERLKQRRALYERNINLAGQEDILTLKSGINLAITLPKCGHVIEAERLLAELYTISRRVHGPTHAVTKQIASTILRLRFIYLIIVVILAMEITIFLW